MEPRMEQLAHDEIPIIWEEPAQEISPEKKKLTKREALINISGDQNLSDQGFLELIITIEDTEAGKTDKKELDKLLKQYDLSSHDIDEKTQTALLLLLHGARKTTNHKASTELTEHAEQKLNEAMADVLIHQIDHFASLLADKNVAAETAENALREIMIRMRTISENIPIHNEEYSSLWAKIYRKFKNVVALKKESRQEISLLMSRILNEYSDFIDEEFIAEKIAQNKIKDRLISMERLMHETYGRDPDEIEDIKSQNRKKTVAAMQELAQKPYVTTKMLITLLGVNNRGLIPKYLVRLRSEPNESVRFGGKRLGIMPEDVAEEMRDFDKRVAATIDQSILENWSDIRYQIAVAQLHNELIEIHPFPDRNGSTSLLFMELMMMRRGYKPQAKREKDYYKNLARILKNNPVAIALIAGEMHTMTTKKGYFKGKTTIGKEKIYEIGLRHLAI